MTKDRRRKLRLEYPAYDPQIKDIAQRTIPENIGYRIVTVHNSIEFVPGEFVKRATVEFLCNQDSAWDIEIVGNGKWGGR